MAQLSLEVPEKLRGLIQRPLLRPMLISSCLSSLLPHQFACASTFEDHICKNLGEIEVIALDNGGEQHAATYNEFLMVMWSKMINALLFFIIPFQMRMPSIHS